MTAGASIIVRPAHCDRWGQRGRIALEPVPKLHCRWCSQPVKPPRRSWCGDACVEEYRLRADWGYIRDAILKRDESACRLCESTHPGYYRRGRAHRDWQTGLLFCYLRVASWEVDHIVPVADGGTDDPLNLRTLCHPCHLRVTTAWRRGRSSRRRAALPEMFALQLELQPLQETA